MPRKHNTIIIDRLAVAAGGVPIERDLPINPISYISLNIRALGAVANTIPSLANLLLMFSNVEVLLDGRTLAQANLADLAVLTSILWGNGPHVGPITKTDNNVILLNTHIPFTRNPWQADEALPTTRRGDLVLRITPAAAYTGFDTVELTVEARQILDAVPERFLKYSTSSKTPAAVGDHDMDLLTGPDYVGTLFYMTSFPLAAAFAASIERLKLKIDDVEQMYPETRIESLIGETRDLASETFRQITHNHESDMAAAYTQYQDTAAAQHANDKLAHYVYVDFDPRKDLAYRLITRGRSRVHYVLNAGVADAIRMIPVEVVYMAPETTTAV